MPTRRNLTDPWLKNRKNLQPAPKGKRYAISDVECPGLKVRVTETGKATFIVWHRWPGLKKYPTGGTPSSASARAIGEVGVVSLTDARNKARAWLALAKAGKDPAELEAQRR